MAQKISQQVLEDFTATITKNPNVSRQKILEAFPEFNNDSALLDAAYDYAETRRMNPYEDIQTINSKFPEFFGGAVEQPAQPAEQPKQPSLLQSIGAHNPYPIQPANPLKAETWDIDKQNRERLERIKSATLPMSDEDKQREAEIERLGKEGAFGTPNGISITYDKRTGSPIITRTEGDGARLYTGVNANQPEIDRLINERPDYMRTPHSEEDIVDNIERAWITNTENGQKAIADAEQRIKDFIASCQENFKYTQQAQQIAQALQSGQIDEQQAQQYADSAFNELYGEVIMQHVQEEKDAFTQAALADNQDYYLKAKRDLQYAATNKVTADAHKQIDNLLKNESAPSVMQLAHSGGQLMRDPYIHAAQNFLYKAEQRMNDMRLDKYEAGDFAKNVAYDLGGILESTATFGLSDLADRSTVTSIFKKVADAAAKAKDPDEIYNNPELVLNDKERAVYTAYTAMISAEMARSLDTSYWADAAKLTADMIPFMLEVGAMNGIFGGINRAAQEGISRGLTRSIVSKLPAGAKKTAAKMFTGAITDIAGAGLYAGESAVMSLALPRTYANMLQKEIDVDYNALKVDNDNLVIGGFDIKSTPEAFMNAWRDQWKEMFTETGGLFNVGANVLFNNPIAKRAFYGIKRSNLGGLIDMFNTGKFFDFAKQVGYHGTYKEWLEEVEGTCWDYAFGDKDAFANFFSRDTQIPMLISFTVPAVLGGGINAGREIKYRMQFKNATNNILNTIKSHGFTDEDFADIKKSLYATPVEDLPATIANMAAALTETEQFGNMYKDYAFYSNKAKYGKLSPEEQQRLDVAAAYLFDSNNAQTEEAKALAAELTKLAYAEVALSAFDKDIASDRRRAYNEAVAFYREQTADIAQEEQAQEQSAPTPYEQIVQDVTRTVNNLAFRNGGELTDDTPVFRVSLNGQEGKQGYIVSGESLPELDATGTIFTNNPLMTIKWDDESVTQHTLNELVLLGVSTAGQRIAQEVEARNDERAVEKIAEGEKPVIMTRGNEVLVLFRKGNGILVDEHDQEYVDTQLFQDGWKLTEDQEELHPNDASGITPMTQGASPSMKPTAPNIDTMSSDEYVRAIVEDRYKGNRTKAQAIISAKLNGAKTDLQVTQKEFDKFQKKGLTSSMNEEQWEAQYDKYEQQIKGLTALVSKLEAANIAVVHYKTQAELQEEAERKAREAAMREQRRQLAEAEAAGDIEAKWQNTKKTVGFAATKTLPNGQKVNGHYILTEAGDVVPSHDPRKNYADSEGYVMENGQNVNDNNYKDPDVQRIALDIAQNYGGQAVEQMPFLENRAGRVLSGNNRTISGIIAAENNTDQAYLAALAENAQQYGFTPEQLAEFQHPRLQFVVEDELPFTTGTFAMFNQQEKKTKSSVNRAVANSKMITEAVRDRLLEIMDQYESLDSFFGSPIAATYVTQTLINESLMTQQEVAEKMEDSGIFNQTGKEYVTDMLLGTLFDEKTIRMLAGEKTLKQAILRALPSIVANRRLKGYELTDSINNAIQLLYEARKANEGKSTADAFLLYLRQVDAFKGSVMDNYSGFDIILANRMSAGVEQLREILGLYNNSAMNEANGQMGFFEPRTIDDIKQDVYEYYTNQQPELAETADGGAEGEPQSQLAVSSGTENAGEVRQLVESQEPLWKQDLGNTLTHDEKLSLIDEISQGSTPVILVSFRNIRPVLEKLGVKESTIQYIESAVSIPGCTTKGFFYIGYAFLNGDRLKNGTSIVGTYVHERQHGFTRNDAGLLKSIVDNSDINELASAVESICGTDFYTKEYVIKHKDHDAMADEFISHVMEQVYTHDKSVADVCAENGFTNPKIIDILNTLDNEQRQSDTLAKSRRSSILNRGAQDSSGQNGRNNAQGEGQGLPQQPSGSSQDGNSGTPEGGQTAERGVSRKISPQDIEIGGALVDRLEDMGVSVSTDLQANRAALKAAKADKSEAGAIHYYKTPSGQQYGFSYKGKVYLDPTKINAELPLHEYGHLWAEALRRLNPENWQHVVDTIKADKDAWEFVKSLRPELTDENEIAEEVIATFSGKKGAEKMRAEYERMHGKDADYKSKWGNIFKNISKAIQDFWKAVGDFLNIKYESAEQVYDQVLKDFVENMNPWKRVSDFLRQRDAEYVQAAESGDIKTATNIFYEALKENIGNGITPYMSVGTYNNLKRLAKGVKTRDAALIKEAADLIAPLIPDNAVLIPAPSHSGTATDMLDLAKAIAELTGSEVADVLRSAPRESQYQAKKTTGVPMASKQLGIAVEGEIPADKTPIIIDNVVDSGNTAEACVQAVGKGVVVTLADSAEQYSHAASLKSAAPVLRDKAGKVIPLSKRFDFSGSRYLGRRMYLRPDDLRLSVSGTQTIPVGKNTLVGLHNISAEKLRKALKMGGLANPSMAVIDIARQNHEQYGDISLIMPSAMVDSYTGRNAGTFTGDIWSPTYPSVERIMSDKGDEAYYQAITKAFGDNEARRPILSRAKLDFDDYLDRDNVRAGLTYWYLLEKGIEPTDIYYNSGVPEEVKERFKPLAGYLSNLNKEEIDQLIAIIADEKGTTVEQMKQDAQEAVKRYRETIDNPDEKPFRKNIAQKAIDEIEYYGIPYGILSNEFHRLNNAVQHDGTIDLDATLIAAQDLVQGQYQADFDKWLADMDKRFDIKEVIFTGYNNEGDRKYIPHTLANASKKMNSERLQNAGSNGGFGATRGQLVEKMLSLAEIRANKNRLRPGEEEDHETEEWNKLGDEWFEKILGPLSDMQKISDNPFSNTGYAEQRLQEALSKADPVAYLNKEYGYKIGENSEWAKNLKDLVQRIKSLPTKYFGTKFRRPVYLDEFRNAVVPNDLPTDLRDGLEKAGLTLFEYNPKEEGARRAATLQATDGEGIRFSVSGGLSTDRTLTKAAREEMQQIKDAALADGTFMKAPNGKPTNLDERQWLQVRTRAFKRWFGDWENDPENASKVLDENGEPMVVYHGTHKDFTTFDKRKIFATNFGKGFYFISDMNKALAYGHYLMPVFLNVRNPLDLTTGENDAEYNKWYGKKRNPYDGYTFIPTIPNVDYTMVVALEPNQIKSAINNDGSFSEENDDIRFSISNQNNDIFYSNAERAVEGIKQEKATPEQWRAMIEKAGGLKVGEDKWIGLSDWLAQQRPTVTPKANETRSQFVERAAAENKRFTLSKQDLLDYIREHKIQIEEQEYGDVTDSGEFKRLEEEFSELCRNIDDVYTQRWVEENNEVEKFYDEMRNKYGDEYLDALSPDEQRTENYLLDAREVYNKENPDYNDAFQEMIRRYGDDFEMAFWHEGARLFANDNSAAAYYADEANAINNTRLQYTTEGLTNKREIALVVPTIESWNEGDAIHFGDAGDGRAVAWVRFGDTNRTLVDGRDTYANVLVIDEIQSKRHQEGRDKGYVDRETQAEYNRLKAEVRRTFRNYNESLKDDANAADRDRLWKEWQNTEAAKRSFLAMLPITEESVPAAPFEKNWHELAMKRILRFAAENGYDKVAWTTGEQQAKRYDIGKEIDHIVKTDENTYEVYPTSGLMMTMEFDENGMYADEYDREYNGKSMSDIFGKDLAKRLKEMPVDETLQGDGLRVGYDGMKGFYDEMLPRFMQKYGKKWGVQVGEVTMPQLEEGYQTMHAIDINDAMRESVLEGQPMFSVTGSRGAANIDKMEGVTTRMDNLAAARQMEEDGKDAKTIRMATGWERGADGKWRYEIDDVQLNADNVKANFRKLDRRGVTAPMVWYHNKFTDIIADSPERKQLLSAYPQLADLDIEFYDYPNKERGAYSSEKKKISVNRANVRSVDECRSVLLHEIQHAIQESELFAKGTSKEQIQLTWKLNNEVHNKVDEYFDKMGFKEWLTSHNGDKAFVDRLMQVIHMFPNRDFNIHYLFVETLPRDKQMEAIDVLGDANDVIQSNRDAIYGADRKGMTMKPDELYHNAAGEVESRNVQNRMNLTPEERRERLLAETEDVAREDQVVIMNAFDMANSANEEDQTTTDKFKAWFGDWQNDPEHASKVVDADGKPLVVEHSTPNEFTSFDINKLGENSGDRGIFGAGFYFGDRGNTDIYGKNHMQVYLNMRKPFVMEDYMPDDISALIVEHFNTPALRKIVLNENGKSITVGEYIDIVNAVNAEMEEGKHDAEIERISSFYRPDSARRKVRDDAIADKSFLIPGSLNYLISTMIGSQEFTNALRDNGNDGVIVGKGNGYNEYVVFSPNQIKSATNNSGEFSKDNNDIRFSVNNPSTLSRSETVTKALVQQANNNYNIMQSALKKVTADLKGIRAAMRMQSDYDRKVVDSLLNLYNTLLQENGVWAQYMPDTTRRIATQIVHAIGKQNITEEVNTIMDHMVHAQAKAAQRQWDKLRQTPIDKINISGVVMQGKVALEGQHALKAMNDALQANMTIEQIEEQINQLMDMEDNATDESLKTQYKGQWIGLTIAAQHLERLQHLQEERQQLDLELQSARSNEALKPAARQQLVENIKQAMRDNYIEQAEAYTRSTQDLSEYVNTQEGRAKDFIRRQDANRDKIRSYAQRDLEGLATNPNRNRTKGNVARSIWDAFASPIRDLQSLLRLTGLHAPDGEGYLYNHFMRNWMDGADMERTGIVAASKTLDEKIAELTHGKYKTWEEAARKINDASHNKFSVMSSNGVDGKDQPVIEEIPLNAGNALYIYAVNKQIDGKMKLSSHNITDEDVKALVDAVREQFGQEIIDVVDWVQSEFFSQLRNRYNPTHEALFGAPMDAIENYFPLRLNPLERQQNEDLSEPDTDAARLLAGTSTGSIKRRKRNSIGIDIRNADFFQEVIRHISQMERWNAFAQWNRDANILFSDINFRNRIKGMKGTIYGEGDKLYNYMKDAFRVAIGTYKPKTDTFSEITLNMAKGVTSAKINFRTFTALKQIASFPAFFTYMQDGVFVGSYLRNWLKPHETMKWAKENLPNFEKRVSKRDMGDMRLMQRSTDWQWNKRILEWSSKYGMFFNVFFDTLTCATGARAVYDSHLADYMKKGYSEEDARNYARQDAEQAFNTSQQSSEGAFMSAVQQDRNLVTAALTVFRTSPIQYTRNFFYHTRNLMRKFGEGKRDEQIAFRMGQYKNDGLNDEQARKAAEKDYNKSLRQDIVGFVVYGAILNILWRLAGQIPYLLLGDDDDKKKQILDDATSGGAWFSPFTGLLGGGIVESALDGNGSVADMFAPEMPFTQDIKRAGQYLSNDKYAEFASQALSVLMQSGTGFDPLTASDMVSRIVTTLDSEEELDAATQALRVSQALLSIPQSQYEQMLIDKVVSGETDEDAALEDYIRYQKIHTAPLTWWLRGEESDEKAEENAEKRFNKLLTDRDKIKNPEDYEE